VKDALLAAGVPGILGLCGGSAACGTCHIYVDPAVQAVVGVAGADEAAMLAASRHQWGNSRLACQIRVTHALDGLRLVVAPLE
jgi:2Fe-2S ferredoxin